MFDHKKEALKDLMSMLEDETEKRIKVIVEGDSPKDVQKGLEAAKQKMKDMPKMMDKEMPMMGKGKSLGKEMKKDMMEDMEDMEDMEEGEEGLDIDSFVAKLSPEDKKKLLKKLGV